MRLCGVVCTVHAHNSCVCVCVCVYTLCVRVLFVNMKCVLVKAHHVVVIEEYYASVAQL